MVLHFRVNILIKVLEDHAITNNKLIKYGLLMIALKLKLVIKHI